MPPDGFTSKAASRKLKSVAAFFFGAETAGAELVWAVTSIGAGTVGSNCPGKQMANVEVGCLDSKCVLASIFFFVALISVAQIVHLAIVSVALTLAGSLPCSSPIPAALLAA